MYIYIILYIYIYIYMIIVMIKLFSGRQTFAIDTGYFWYLNTCIYNLQSCYETSRQNKKVLQHFLLAFFS